MHFLSNSPKKSWGLTKMHYLCSPKWCHGRVVRQRSAKPSTAVRFCLAPLQTPFSDAERGFAILDLATTLLQIKKTPNHFIDSESGGIQNEVAFRQQHLSQRYSNFSINQSLTIFVSGTGELKCWPRQQSRTCRR